MRGRKPKPTALKMILGNPGRRRLNKREPVPERDLPTCPSHLLPTAKAEWKRVVHQLFVLGVISRLDRAALAAYCQAYARWVEAERKLLETPVILKMPSGYIQQNPWLIIATKHMELMQKFAAELGMTPSSRSRVETIRRSSSKFAGLLGADNGYLNGSHPSDRFSKAAKPWEFG